MVKNILIPFFMLTLSALSAATYTVPGDYAAIQAAITTTIDGDSIIVAPGFYYENIDFLGKAIVITSRFEIENDTLLIDSTVIDGLENGSVCTFKNGENSNSVLSGFTLKNGNGNNEDPDENGSYFHYGGGIYCQGSSPTIIYCTIQNNNSAGGGGGGIFCFEASPVFQNCTVVDNSTDDVGGGLYARNGSSPEFFHCRFTGNVAEYGGGCYLRTISSPMMSSTVVENNTASNTGGGIVLKDDANLVADSLFIKDNISEGLGGGLYINNANPDLSWILITDNTASSGGGLYIRSSSFVDITHATIANNIAGLFGDGFYLRDDCEVIITNSIIYSNQDIQIYFRDSGDEASLDIDYSNVEHGEDGIVTNGNANLTWGNYNMAVEPFFCNESAGNYYLRENSPCVTGGDNNDLMGCFGPGCGPINVGPSWYVAVDGNDDMDGSLETPFATIQRAIDGAADGDTIRLNPGTYIESINFIEKQLVLESLAYEQNNFNLINATILSSPPAGRTCLVLSGSESENATLRGITISGGSDPYGGGLVIENCSPVLENLIVRDNNAEIGGGIYLSDSDALLVDVTVRENSANLGGGIYITGGSPVLHGVWVESNIAYWGAGLYFESAEPSLLYATIRENDAFIEGGGLYQMGGTGNISWTAFEQNNGSDFGGGIVGYQAAIVLNQATFAGNAAGDGSVIAMYSSAVEIQNSIIWGNNGDIFRVTTDNNTSTIGLSFSNVEGGATAIPSTDSLIVGIGAGLLNEDPDYCNVEDNDYRVSDGSICVTASDSGSIIGAYENTCEGPLTVRSRNDFHLGFQLKQNYPNPFNPTTTIEYNLVESGYHSMRVYSLDGRLIRTIKNEFGGPGSHKITWNGKNDFGKQAAAGMYLYILDVQYRKLFGKMLLLK